MTVLAVLLIAVGSYLVLAGKARRIDLEGGLLGKPRGAFATPQRFARLGVAEPSGVAFHPKTGHLFVIGDDGKLAEVDTSGKVVRSLAFPGNLEDVAVHTPTGDLLVLSEMNSELILYDPIGHQERKRWRLDKMAVLGRTSADSNQGFEGLAFRPDGSQPGGGVFDLNRPAGTLGADVVKARWEMTGYEDLTAITYVAELDRLLVVSDAKDVLIVMRTDGTVERVVPLPGKQQEGIAVDAEGNIWVADDRDKSLLKLEGGLDTLRDRETEPQDGRATGRPPG
jgi:uncharacterized protein YjiK